MPKPKKKPAGKPRTKKSRSSALAESGIRLLYEEACQTAARGKSQEAHRLYDQLASSATDAKFKALLANDRAALAAMIDDLASARTGFQEALKLDPTCEPARLNLAVLDEEESQKPAPQPTQPISATPPVVTAVPASEPGAIRVAVLSFLFNWPSTGGGIVHTVELAQFLAKAGYTVQHIYAHFPPWHIGGVDKPTPHPSQALEFTEADWNAVAIQKRYRAAVDAFGPDYVIITDSWNFKPLLAEAVRGYRYFMRMQAMECLCPFNNVRLLPEPEGRFRQCPLHQLANPQECQRCLQENAHRSGDLHRRERALSGVGTPAYQECLLRAMREAEAVLVVNPLHEAIVSPYARAVRVITSGFDTSRFPWPWPDDPADPPTGRPLRLLFAGLVDEFMKGFAVLLEACTQLWQKRQDFEIVATADPPGRQNDFTRFIGWQAQENLPRQIRAADVLIMPTIAQEALGRTAVEAMAAGRPVIASRLGGLPFTVVDGATGLLFEPGDAKDLAAKIETLLDDQELRERMGRAGRKRFEEHYSWDVIIERQYKPLLCRRRIPA
jgi:glycosyltransferase involved in cell wall biosynthesis